MCAVWSLVVVCHLVVVVEPDGGLAATTRWHALGGRSIPASKTTTRWQGSRRARIARICRCRVFLGRIGNLIAC